MPPRWAPTRWEAFELLLDAGLQPHHETALAQPVAIVARQHGARAGCQEHAAALAQRVQLRALALAEAGFALELEHRAHVHAAMLLDLLVEIDEREPIMHGEPPADRGLAGTGRTDDEQVARRIHGVMLTGAGGGPR